MEAVVVGEDEVEGLWSGVVVEAALEGELIAVAGRVTDETTIRDHVLTSHQSALLSLLER